MENGGRYMENIEAEITSVEGSHYIQINTEPAILIPISDDNANTVKSAFNSLVRRLQNGVFEIKLKETEKDLFYHVANEYLRQLNSELLDVYEEMKQFEFANEDVEESKSLPKL